MGEVVDERQFTIHAALHVEQLRQPSLVESAMAEHATALLHALDTAVANVAGLEQTLTIAFDQHPDAQIITSFPGLSTVLGARILAEIGDDRSRFATARGLKAFAGTAPVTRASGMKTVVTRRVARCTKDLGQGLSTERICSCQSDAGSSARSSRLRRSSW